jgi:hypothetical protein
MTPKAAAQFARDEQCRSAPAQKPFCHRRTPGGADLTARAQATMLERGLAAQYKKIFSTRNLPPEARDRCAEWLTLLPIWVGSQEEDENR